MREVENGTVGIRRDVGSKPRGRMGDSTSHPRSLPQGDQSRPALTRYPKRIETRSRRSLFARSARDVFQIRLTLLGFLSFRFADDESAAAYVFGFVELVVFRRVQLGVHQCITLRLGKN